MEHPADEIRNLKACINDLISVLALPARWAGREPSQILGTLLDVLLGMLRLDFAYARLNDSIGGTPVEMVRLAGPRNLSAQPQEIGQLLNPWLTGDPRTSPLMMPNPIGKGEISIASFKLGLQDEVGVLLAGSQRADFPTETERLLLGVAANQAAIGLHNRRRENTERRRAEEALRESEERWRAVFDNSAAGIALANPSGRFLAGNLAYQKMLGYLEKELRELSFLDITHEDYRDANSELTTELLEGKRQYFEMEKRYRRKDGNLIWVHVHVSLVSGKQITPRFLLAIVDNITERKRAEEALRDAQMELAHVTRVATLGEMTASIAHEINQPLGALVNNAGACLGWLDAENLEEARNSVALMMDDAQRASEIITRIRALVKKIPPQKDWLDINQMIREIIGLARNEMQRNAVALETQLSDDVPLVFADRIQLQQVMLNLMMNAIEAMTQAAGARELLISSGADDSKGVVVVVRDSGPGLDSKSLERLFEPFYTTKPQGMGMGLAICRSIVQVHGGRLWAISNRDRGASFHFTLPTSEELA